MEYVDGETLASLVRRIGQLPLPKAACVRRRYASAQLSSQRRRAAYFNTRSAASIDRHRGGSYGNLSASI